MIKNTDAITKLNAKISNMFLSPVSVFLNLLTKNIQLYFNTIFCFLLPLYEISSNKYICDVILRI